MKLSITLNNDRNAAIKFVTQSEPSVDLPSQISVNDKIITNPTDILNACARHFFPPDPPSNSAHREVEKCAKEISSSCDTEPPPDLTTRELSEALGALQHDAAPGPDGIDAPILSLCLTIIRPLFHQLLSSCIASPYFLQAWRHARIRIISKHNKSEFSTLHSFRPISVINTSAKVLEKVILARLRWAAKQGNWFSNHQHGFLSERSTETAAHDLISYIENGFSQKQKTAAVFIDIKSAFDSAWHPAILKALAAKGCPPYLIRIINSFLSSRRGTIRSQESEFTFRIATACPQGSALSAFLWIVLIDSVLSLSFDFPVLLLAYADDLIVAVRHKDMNTATKMAQIVCAAIVKFAT